jgi:hypothetical protein
MTMNRMGRIWRCRSLERRSYSLIPLPDDHEQDGKNMEV